MKKKIMALGLALLLLLSMTTGCVKVVKIGQEGKLTGEVKFNAGDDVAKIWKSKALPELDKKAVDLKEFLTEANGDLKSLVKKYGKYSMGSSGEINYVVKGRGKVTEVNQKSKAGYLTLQLEDYSGPEVIHIQIGPVYKGSSIRDSLSFIKFGDYTNQEQWAAVSQSINSLVDKQVVKKADLASAVGQTVSFEGTFTAADDQELDITPVALTEK